MSGAAPSPLQVPDRALLIVWWSMTGGTRQLASAVAEGAARGGDDVPASRVQVRCLSADEAGPADLLSSAGYVFATPENLGTMAGRMKDFFDRSYYPVLDRLNGRPYAVVVCAGSDGEGAVRQVDRIVTGWRLRRASPPLIVRTGAQTPEAILAPKTIPVEQLARAAELGEALAAGLAMGVF